MDKEQLARIRSITRALRAVLQGGLPRALPEPDPSDPQEIQELCATAASLIAKFAQAGEFLTSLSDGRLDVEPPPQNFLVSPFKQFRSVLLHLTWQTIQVANGDLSQQVDFLGKFSQAFNSMVASLREKRVVEEKLGEAHADLLEANQNILDSMEYAQTIQTAFLPDMAEMTANTSELFVIWKPKDVIGGDMYTFRAVPEGFLIAVIDCTGHGVPGGVMTMIAGSLFDRAVETCGYRDPAQILRRLNRLMKTALHQHSAETKTDDGLDIGLCFVDRVDQTLKFAGANIPLFYCAEESIHYLAGDKHSIGYKNSDVNFSFTNHRIPLTPGLTFYMTTDGLTDQTGGERGFSFGRRRLMGAFQANVREPLSRQREALEATLAAFQGDEPQLDDITVIGFRS